MKYNHLEIQPIEDSYRIILKEEEYRPIVMSGDGFTYEQLETICQAFDDRLYEARKEGWADGYSQGYSSALQ